MDSVTDPDFQQCAECGGDYPYPVHLHHDSAECLAEQQANP